ncbi:MAG: prolipoprotein diacylglyceryl transferase [Corallococcus sp.]|nr:prolipoprotein diacylglyceryl transferase [Corallococcus sp.]
MDTLLLNKIFWGSETFGYGSGTNGNPAVFIFGLPIYLYAIIIVTGMSLAILVAGKFFKKRGYDPYDICTYAIAVIPLGVLGARLYVFIFPWEGQTADWSRFFDIRDGGLGIYGGVILGYLAALLVSKLKKQDFKIVADCIMPGLLLAQSIGRWGNFANQEAHGSLITTDYSALPNFFQWISGGQDHGFNGYAVWINNGRVQTGWYQATFFYESAATFIGFLICVIVLMRSKQYKLGWCTAFYGIYYGIVRLIIEGMRTDSLYLWIGSTQTDIKISQLVSVFAILMGLLTLSKIYRKQLHALYSKLFKSERAEVAHSRWILLGLSVILTTISVIMYVLGGETRFIVGFLCDAVAVYSVLGIFALNDRLKLYCNKCGVRNEPACGVTNEYDTKWMSVAVFSAVCGALVVASIVCAVLGAVKGVANLIVLAVVAILCAAACGVVIYSSVKYIKQHAEGRTVKESLCAEHGESQCSCGNSYEAKLNKFLLFVFPYKKYPDYGVENLHEWVDKEKLTKKDKKSQSKQGE